MRSSSDPLLTTEAQLPPGQIYLDDEDSPREPLVARYRRSARNFLSSRFGHYLILFLVSVDVACVFADFLIELHVCELEKRYSHVPAIWAESQEGLEIVGLVFSCLFMVELIVAVFSFGTSYFSSKFHVFDSLVIVVAFGIDVAMRGLVEELGSLVVVLRLWRVFKIIEELESASADSMEEYEREIERLREENDYLRERLELVDEE
ncbi:hypothetical protein BO94DRAFT_520338 [Aspergillus sclerotioniger CBS 115572]|uniref:Voltage-gated hydrogen channel 1 n=1 Tax=Aspergillus sclerotioniger CBS 115572 TaxID=1450535 RepID=A0A317W6N5_9EURO|nr:hypothetical protein BO94DRAFT_520338 [Aspergillus sclerotioniger CBS 115572]PWY81615.1 hypothetical protein BO94DRAFT_520338 [Aspergillus sclerotioniger CBS 115572]